MPRAVPSFRVFPRCIGTVTGDRPGLTSKTWLRALARGERQRSGPSAPSELPGDSIRRGRPGRIGGVLHQSLERLRIAVVHGAKDLLEALGHGVARQSRARRWQRLRAFRVSEAWWFGDPQSWTGPPPAALTSW